MIAVRIWAKITTLFVDKGGVLIDNARLSQQYRRLLIDDPERAIGWARTGGLGGVLVRRGPGEPFEQAVIRAFDEVHRARA
jgi:hypothetical protein